MVIGLLYWAVWKLLLPYVFGFRLVPRKEALKDGTVVTLVSSQDTISILRLNLYFFRSSPEKRWNEADDAIDYEKSQRT